jgi:hypothetical protein
MLRALETYESMERDFKALAIHPDYGFSASSSHERTPAEAIEAAIKKCSEPNLRCRLYYLGDKLIYDEPDITIEEHKKKYATEVINSRTGNKLQKFLTEPKYSDFKAFAFDNETWRIYYAWGYKWHPRLTAKRALHKCERRSWGPAKCDLVAVGNTIVFGEPQQKIERIIDAYFHRIAGPSGVPLPLQAYLKAWYPQDYRVLVVDKETGSHAMVSAQRFLDRAIDKALDICRRKRNGCQLYAVGDEIIHDKPSQERKRMISEYQSRIADRRIEKSLQNYLMNIAGMDDYRALVADRRSGVTMSAAGKASVKEAIEEPKEACVRAGTTCELYAVGNHSVIELNDEQTEKIISEYERILQTAP